MCWQNNLPLIAILRGIRPEEVIDHVGTLIKAGFYAIEIPTNSPEWEKSVGLAVEKFGHSALIGAGTVLNPTLVDALARQGGKLMVTPNVDVPTIRAARSAGMTICCGCATATEAFTALNAGAEVLKIFPANIYGAQYAKALRAVLPADTPIFAVGGVTPVNLREFMQGGFTGAGLGSDLYRAGQTPADTHRQAKAYIGAYQSLTNN